jgi:hypothetical protein
MHVLSKLNTESYGFVVGGDQQIALATLRLLFPVM